MMYRYSWAVLLVWVICLNPVQAKPQTVLALHPDPQSAWGMQLHSGQIVVSESSEPINLIYLLLNSEFSPFIHAGIVDAEGGDVYVYEAGGSYKLSAGNAPPTDNVKGWVRKTPFADFLSDAHTINVFSSPAGLDVAKTLHYAKQTVEAKTPFDAYFNYEDHAALYCSEFVALALEAGFGHQLFTPTPIQPNKSIQTVLGWLKVKDNRVLPVYKLVEPSHWEGTLSLDHSPLELQIERAVKLEIYQRFTQDQKLGNILDWGAMGVALRGPLVAFREAAFAAFENNPRAWTAEDIVQVVRKVADQTLGVVKNYNGRQIPRCQIDLGACAR